MQWMDLIRPSIDTTIDHISVKAFVWEYPDFFNQRKVAYDRLNELEGILQKAFPDTKVKSDCVRLEGYPGEDPNHRRLQVLPMKK
jgi:hypothetical protein